jgi:hypothetical protein
MSENRWKYVVVEHPEWDGIQVPIIFPEILEHKYAARLGRAGKVISAGFCTVDPIAGLVEAHGESVGLGVRSRGQKDAELLRICFVGNTSRLEKPLSNSP